MLIPFPVWVPIATSAASDISLGALILICVAVGTFFTVAVAGALVTGVAEVVVTSILDLVEDILISAS